MQNRTGQNGRGHESWQRWAGKAWQIKPLQANTAGRRSGRHRSCSKQLADDPTVTGLAVKQLADDPAGTGLAVKQPADEVGQPLAVFNGGWWRECGGAGHSEGVLRPT